MSVYKIFILFVFNREYMERNVMISFRILSSFECFLRYFEAEWSVFFTLQCELFTSCNVSNNASLVSAWTGGGWVVNQMWIGLDRGRGFPKISKFVRTCFMGDLLCTHILFGLRPSGFAARRLNSTKTFWKTLVIATPFLSFKGASHTYINVNHT